MNHALNSPSEDLREVLASLNTILLDAAARNDDALPGLTETCQKVVLYVAGGRPRLLGWYCANRWQHGEHRVPEIVLSAEFLGEPADALLTTLLHEAGHAWAEANAIRDTSRDGRYHNRRFGEIAVQLGLRVQRDDTIGLVTPGLSPAGFERYADLLPTVAEAQRLVRLPLSSAGAPPEEVAGTSDEREGGEGTATTDTSRYVFASCGCRLGSGRPRTIRIARGGWIHDGIECRSCGQAFAPTRGGI